MTQSPSPSPTVSVFTTLTFWSVFFGAVATVWQAIGFNPGLLDQVNHAIPLLLQAAAAMGVLIDHTTASPRKVGLRSTGLKSIAIILLASATLATLAGCPPVSPAAGTQPVSPTAQQLANEQATLNTVQIAVSIGYDAFTLYISANPNPAEAALAAKAYNAVEAAITSAQGHINAGDPASAQLALADVQAAFSSFLTSTAKAQVALHKSALTARGH